MPEHNTDARDAEADKSVERWVENLINQMTLAEKIGQMTQVEKDSITPDEVASYTIGSVLSGGGGNPTPNTPEAWAKMVRSYQEPALKTRLGIPLLYGVDAVHGHNNVYGAVIFPHNIGLGATRDGGLVERIGRITATELIATNVHWNFAPSVGVPQDIRWGRTYEGYSENTDLVSQLGVAYLRGLQNVDNVPNGVSVIGTIKHFVGDGGTKWGSIQVPDWMADVAKFEGAGRLDQGATEVDETTLRTTHLPPYTAAVEAGAKSIMVSHSSWGGLKMHAQKYLLTEVLKGELGFKGFVVSDWMGIDQIDLDRYQRVVASVNAGLDMVMVPYDFKPFIADLTRAVGIGDVPLARINDAVRRILTVKFELGLFENPFGDDALVPLIGCEAHRDVAREAVRKSVVLLKNDDHTLPLPKKTPLILIAGQAADDVGLQCGGWTIEWQGETGDITEGTTLLKAIRQTVSQSSVVRYKPNGKFAEDDSIADVGIVVLSEPPYAEGAGDRADLVLPPEDAALLQRVRPRCKKLIVILFSGRPLIITDHLHKWDAFIAAWLPGTEGQGIADVLFGDYPFTGRLPYTWPRSIDQIPLHNTTQSGSDLDPPLFSYGYGLSI